VQRARFPDPSAPIVKLLLDVGVYMRDIVKTIRDAELAVLKKTGKGKGSVVPHDPKKPRTVRIYVATRFPEWQDACLATVKDAWSAEYTRVDDVKVRAISAAAHHTLWRIIAPY